MSMTEEEKLKNAFSYVWRYELYRLLRAWGVIVTAIGLGYFFTSWWLFLHLYRLLCLWFRNLLGGLTDEQEILLGGFVLGVQGIIFIVVAVILIVVMILTYLSVTRVSIKNQDITSKRMRLLGVSLLVLFCFTFFSYAMERLPMGMVIGNTWFVQLIMNPLVMVFLGCFLALWGITPYYLPHVLAIFLAYRLLRSEMSSYDFKEMHDLIFLLLILSVIEFSWRIIFLQLINPLYGVMPVAHYVLFQTIFFHSYLFFDFVVAVSFGASGLQSWRRAGQVLDGELICQ